MVRCKFCSTGYVLNKDDYDGDFACEKCQKLYDYIKDQDLFLMPLKKILEYHLNLKLCDVKLETMADARRILVYTDGADDYDFCFESDFRKTIFGDIEIFLFVKHKHIRIKYMADLEKDLGEIL